MADTAIAITAGTGTNIDTRTEGTNGNHRQVVVVGDPATNAGVAPVDATAGLKVDLGADNDITGTVTANLGATDNAVLDAIEADTTTLAGAVAGTEMQVDIVTSALPSGAATSAKQDTQITAEQAIQTSVELIDDAIRAEDVASGDGHKGVVMMAVRQDTPANTSATDGDYEMPKMSAGRMWVDASGKTLTVDGSGVTQPVSNAGLTELAAAINSSKVDVNIVSSDVATGGTSAADDADFTAGTTTGTPAQGVYESTPTSVTDGDLGTVGITSGRRLKTSATIDAALPAGTNAIGKLSANSGVDIGDVDITSIAAGDNNIGNVDIASIAAGDNNIGNVDVVTLPDVTNAGTFAVQVDGAALTSLQLIDDAIFVDDTATHSTGSTKGIGIMAAATPTDTSISANDIGMVGMTTDRKLHVAVMDALPAGTAAIGKLAANSGVDIGDVDVISSALPTGASTLAEQQTQTTALQLIDNSIYVDDADWTADTSSHTLAGAVTQVATTANTDGDTTPLVTNAFRELRTAIPESDLATATTSHVKKYYTNAGAVTDGIVWSPAAGKRWYVTDLIINVSAATTVTFEDDKAGGDEAVMKFELAANSGVSHNFTTPWYSGEDAADLIVTTTAGNVYITCVGYEI